LLRPDSGIDAGMVSAYLSSSFSKQTGVAMARGRIPPP
jgi:hypothetical protein